MTKIATYRESVKQATEQRVQALMKEAETLATASQQIDRLNQRLTDLPEQIAKRILPAAESLDAIVQTTAQTLNQVRVTLDEAERAKKDTEQTVAMLEHQARRLEDTARALLKRQKQQSQKDLIKIAALSAIGAATLSLVVTLSTLSFWPSQQAEAEIGRRVLEVLPHTDQRTRDWLNSNFVQPR